MTDSTSQEMTGQKAQALAGLLSGQTIPAVAKRLGVNRVTVWHWTKEPTFAAEYAAARRAAVAAATSAAQAAAVDAVRVMVSLMNNPKVAHSTRLRAAQLVYEGAVSAIELDDVVQRLEALEAANANRS